MRNYIALIHKEADSDYGVSFPDLPGLISVGSSLDEARVMASEALAFHLEGLAQEGQALPEPSSLEVVMSDPANRDGVAVLIAAPLSGTPKVVRVNITVAEDLLNAIDQHAEAHGFTRSGFLASAARRAIEASAPLLSSERDNPAEGWRSIFAQAPLPAGVVGLADTLRERHLRDQFESIARNSGARADIEVAIGALSRAAAETVEQTRQMREYLREEISRIESKRSPRQERSRKKPSTAR
jgi:predicted RNase H-like HicB family nuclease